MPTIKLKCTDRADVIQEFELDYAQRILDVKHPQRGWVLFDTKYKMEKGKITEIPAEPDPSASKNKK